MKKKDTQPITKQDLVNRFQQYGLHDDVPIPYENAGNIDFVIGNNDKKYYIIFKGDLSHPATSGDVFKLNYMRGMDKKNKKDYRYAIYCTRANNIITKNTAIKNKINYYQSFDDLADNVVSYIA